MKAAGVILAVAVALVLQTTLARFIFPGLVWMDLVLVAVVYVALKMGPAAGLLAGTFGGLAQDALSSGVIGIGGLAKTVIGFFVGIVGAQFIVAQPIPRFVVFALATLAHAGILMGLYNLLGLRSFEPPYLALAGQVAGNALIGVVAFHVVELLPGSVRRRAARSGLRR